MWVASTRDAERAVHDQFIRLLGERRLSVIDLRPDFEAAGDPLRYTFEEDAHWNARGHALAARVIADRIVADGQAGR
jgi:hypothetical protein